MSNTKQLAERMVKLANERDSIVQSKGYNRRCYEIDDNLIPEIIGKVPKGKMGEFNRLTNQVV